MLDCYEMQNKKEQYQFFFVGQLHKDVLIEEHPGNLTIFCHNALKATAYQLI